MISIDSLGIIFNENFKNDLAYLINPNAERSWRLELFLSSRFTSVTQLSTIP